jgi:nucleoside 2-deoxyribosyltransferase
MTKLYMAGPLFTVAERTFNVWLARRLEAQNYQIWLPQEHEPRDITPRNIFLEDVKGIDWADAVLLCAEGADLDSGTCWEAGYAYAKGKPVYCYRTDFRGGESGDPYNLMISESATAHIELSSLTAGREELFARIFEMLQSSSSSSS